MTYKSISSLCEMYDVHRSFFERKMADRTFVRNKHYVKQGNTVRFNLHEIEKWWSGEDNTADEIVNRLMVS